MELDKDRAVLEAEKNLRKEYEKEIRELNQEYVELIAAKLQDRKPEEGTKENV